LRTRTCQEVTRKRSRARADLSDPLLLWVKGAARYAHYCFSPPNALHDSYVEYVLLVALIQPSDRIATMDRLHANILDVFNEFDVQITSPNYEGDPEAPKTVPRSRWYAAPAVPEVKAVDQASV